MKRPDINLDLLLFCWWAIKLFVWKWWRKLITWLFKHKWWYKKNLLRKAEWSLLHQREGVSTSLNIAINNWYFGITTKWTKSIRMEELKYLLSFDCLYLFWLGHTRVEFHAVLGSCIGLGGVNASRPVCGKIYFFCHLTHEWMYVYSNQCRARVLINIPWLLLSNTRASNSVWCSRRWSRCLSLTIARF